MHHSTRARRSLLPVVSAIAVLTWHASFGQDPALRKDMPEHFEPTVPNADYVRTDVMIPMRDGVRLHTVVLSPREVPKPAPMVLTRTPYNATKLSTRSVSPHLEATLPLADQTMVRAGYIRIYQDIRGKQKSEGIYVMTAPVRGPLNSRAVDETTDAFDTIDWLVHNVPHNNGRVGMIGTSFEGYLALMALLDPHPALHAVIPVNPMVDGWMGDDWFRLGAFRQVMIDYIYTQTSSPRSEFVLGHGYHDDYDFFLTGSSGHIGERSGVEALPFWELLTHHPNYDEFWQGQAVNRLLESRRVNVPTMLVHSLFDQEDIYGALASYSAIQKHEGGRDSTYVVLGPWSHGPLNGDGSSLGHIKWDSSTVTHFREKFLQPFLDRFLTDQPQTTPALPHVEAFDTGRHVWREYNRWPQSCPTSCPSPMQTAFLQTGHRLTFGDGAKEPASFEEYESDPAKPVPYRVRPIRPIASAGSTWSEWLTDDQRPFSDRTDVLTYTSDPLTQPLSLAGQPEVRLRASTTGSDSDWIVKLIDVFPPEDGSDPALGGYQLMVSSQILRGRFRDHLDHPQPTRPNEILEYAIEMPALNHTLLPGHRLMVQIQSSWFPLYDRNPQQYVANIFWAKPDQYLKARIRIYQGGATGSRIALPVIAPP